YKTLKKKLLSMFQIMMVALKNLLYFLKL
ncbi:MAG: hypothetical protein CFH40_02421, partial [Alphaproteobacteria bacterium MarineAlpha10_Bin3]